MFFFLAMEGLYDKNAGAIFCFLPFSAWTLSITTTWMLEVEHCREQVPRATHGAIAGKADLTKMH